MGSPEFQSAVENVIDMTFKYDFWFVLTSEHLRGIKHTTHYSKCLQKYFCQKQQKYVQWTFPLVLEMVCVLIREIS
jgi:hypothetical protein